MWFTGTRVSKEGGGFRIPECGRGLSRLGLLHEKLILLSSVVLEQPGHRPSSARRAPLQNSCYGPTLASFPGWADVHACLKWSINSGHLGYEMRALISRVILINMFKGREMLAHIIKGKFVTLK